MAESKDKDLKDHEKDKQPAQPAAPAAPALSGATVDVYNRGERTYFVGKDKDGNEIRLEPGKSASVPKELAKNLIGDKGYDDLIDPAKVSPGARKREEDLKTENEKLRAENERLKAESEKGGKK